jgi:hypothetical protein
MTMFNPSAPEWIDKDRGGDAGGRLAVAGDYLLVCTRYSRQKSNAGKPFLLCTFRVISGPQKNKTFMERIYLNDEALWKLARFCKAVGHEASFNLGSDRELTSAIVRRPFKVRVSIKTEGDKKYTQIDFWYFEVTEEEGAIIDEWVAEAAADPDNDHRADGSVGGKSSGVNDDDIPF